MTVATKTAAPSMMLPLAELTAREVEVLTLVADGQSNAEIGARLFLSPDTIRSHLARIGVKLAIGDRAGMVGAAYRRGILLPDPEQAAVKPEPPPPPAVVVSELDGLMLRIVIMLLRGEPLETLVPMARRAHRIAVVTGRLR